MWILFFVWINIIIVIIIIIIVIRWIIWSIIRIYNRGKLTALTVMFISYHQYNCMPLFQSKFTCHWKVKEVFIHYFFNDVQALKQNLNHIPLQRCITDKLKRHFELNQSVKHKTIIFLQGSLLVKQHFTDLYLPFIAKLCLCLEDRRHGLQ